MKNYENVNIESSNLKMENYKGLSVNSLCRACLKILNLKSKNIYNFQSFPHLLDLIKIIQVEKSSNDQDLPSNLCKTCHNKLQDIFIFQKQCNQSFSNLQNLIQNNILTLNVISKDDTENKSPEKTVEYRRVRRSVMIREEAVPNDDVKNTDPVKRTRGKKKEAKITPETEEIEPRNLRPKRKSTAMSEKRTRLKENIKKDVEQKLKSKTKFTKLTAKLGEPLPEDEATGQIEEQSTQEEIIVEVDFMEETNEENYLMEATTEENYSMEETNGENENFFSMSDFLAINMEVNDGENVEGVCENIEECNESDIENDSSFNEPKRKKFDDVYTATINDEQVTFFKCQEPGCSKTYTSETSLKGHLRAKHPDKFRKTYECCGTTFTSKADLNLHMTNTPHEVKKPYKCEACDKSFTTKYTFDQHNIRHTTEKRFTCSYCGLQKYTKSELNKHINIHTRLKKYSCVYPGCSYVGHVSGAFGRHVRTVHKKIKNFQCQFCDSRFSRKENLEKHEMTHTGEKPYTCDICGRGFIQLFGMKTHRKTHFKKKKGKKDL
ncbi:hypothetical protein ACFFRR_005045 [Megaselia abdita]